MVLKLKKYCMRLSHSKIMILMIPLTEQCKTSHHLHRANIETDLLIQSNSPAADYLLGNDCLQNGKFQKHAGICYPKVS